MECISLNGRDPFTAIRACGYFKNEHIVFFEKKKDAIYVAASKEIHGAVSAYVIPYQLGKGAYDFAFKVIHENSQPYCTGASKKFMKLLSPTEAEGALMWREAVVEGHSAADAAKKLIGEIREGKTFSVTPGVLRLKSGAPVNTLRHLDGDSFKVIPSGEVVRITLKMISKIVKDSHVAINPPAEDTIAAMLGTGTSW